MSDRDTKPAKLNSPNEKHHPSIYSRLEHIRCNGEPDATISDAYDYAMGDCGQLPDGSCTMAGSEQCDFDCTFRDD